jgi:hypothetical protein
LNHDATVGVSAGLWDPEGLGIGLPIDQRVDHSRSLTYSTTPLENATELTGHPKLSIFVDSSSELISLTAKLCDVDPDGRVDLVTTGWLNPTSWTSGSQTPPLVPGHVYEYGIDLWPTSYLFDSGHRIALNIASSDFPRIWPTPKLAVTGVWHTKKRPSCLTVPVVPQQLPKLTRPELYPPGAPSVPSRVLIGEASWKIVEEPESSKITVVVSSNSKLRMPADTIIQVIREHSAEASRNDPAQAFARNTMSHITESPLGKIEVKTSTTVSNHSLFLTATILKDGVPMFVKSWREQRE